MNIPEEIFLLIIDYFDFKNLVKSSILSKKIYNYSTRSIMWSQYYKNHYNKYIFDNNTSNYRSKLINIIKLKKIYKKILKNISKDNIVNLNKTIIFSNFKELKWLNNNKHLIEKKNLRKVKTEVRCHKYRGYFISTVYFINYDQIYFSNYFVNNSECFDIIYKLDY